MVHARVNQSVVWREGAAMNVGRRWLPVVLGLLLAGCAGDAGVATTPFPEAAATPVAAVETEPPAMVPESEAELAGESEGAPAPEPTDEMLRKVPSRPVNSDEDVREVYDDLVEAAAALGHYPDPDRVADVYDDECVCYDDLLSYVQYLSGEGLHVDEPAIPKVVSFDVLARTGGHFAAHVVARGNGVGNALRRDTGQVVEQRDGVWEREMTVTASARNGLWRFTGLAIDREVGFE